MYGFTTKSILFTIFSAVVVGTITISSLGKNNTPASNDDGLNEYPMSATEYMLQRELENNPAAKAMISAQEAPYYNHMATGGNAAESVVADFTLPVVVHIIHQNGAENIDNSQVEDAIEHLNDAFENVGYYDQGTGVNTQIEFCLAKTGPDGYPTTGVTRVEDPLTNMTIESDDLDLKNLDRWDPTEYINIWVVASIASDAFLSTIRGYAYLPAFHGTDRDGIVIEAEWMGSSEENSTALVREMGHYLGLYSTFHAGCGNDDCLLDGDRVCDTPPDWTIAEAPCEVDENSCFTDVNLSDPNNPFTQDENDMRENYMDINPLACYSAFTQGQTDRMTFFINGDRSSLLNTLACDNDCDNPIENFAISNILNDTTFVINSGPFNIQSSSTNATTFSWTLNGLEVGTGANYNFDPDSAGVFTLTLTANNSNVNCAVDSSLQITVIDCFGNAWVDDATGVDVFMCGQPNSPCKTIQYALDNSVCNGDTIFIRSGTYMLPSMSAETTIARIPEDYTVTFFGVEETGPIIIDGQTAHRGFEYDYSSDPCPPSQMDNEEDVIHQINFANLTIQNTQVTEQVCTNGAFRSSGAAIHIVNAVGSTLNVSIDNCRLLNNVSVDDEVNNISTPTFGAVYFDGKVDDLLGLTTSATFTVSNSEFSENRAIQVANGGVGGALSLFSLTSANISDSYFCENSAEGINSDDGDLSFDRNAGGAIAIFDRSNLAFPFNHNFSINNSYFFNNEATTTNGISFVNQSEGGAIFLGGDLLDQAVTSTAVLNINNSAFFNNNIEPGIEHFDNSVGTVNQIGNTLSDDPFAFDLGNDTTICNIDSITIGTDIPGSEYLWNTGATTSTITISDTGTYVLTIAMGACSFVDSIQISEIICGEICGNGIDDDGDGLIDCFDPECCGQDGCDLAFYNECPDPCIFTNSDSDVQAEVKWQSDVDVSMVSTPVTGDIDNDGIPEIIVPQQSLLNNRLSILNGLDGTEEVEIDLPTQDPISYLAIADVDKDGTGEIFYYAGNTIFRFEHDGTQTADTDLIGPLAKVIGIADFNEDGTPEVYTNHAIFSSDDLTVIATIPVAVGDAQFGVAVDVLEDSACPNCEGLEFVAGNKVFSVDIDNGSVFPAVEAALEDGIISIADVDKDGDLDGVVAAFNPAFPTASANLIYAWELQTDAIIGQFDPGDNPSPATIADIDGDGQLDIVFKTSSNIVALESNFTQKWTTFSAEDDTNVTSPVTFDFDGDGDFEIVSRGTERIEILDGTNGNIMFDEFFLSASGFESPVIVDVDGDGLTEILVSGATSPGNVNNDEGVVRAYTSSTFPWQTTRSVWNQNAYFNVQIEDALSIPIVQQEHHIVGNDVVLNNFLAQHGEQLGADAVITNVDVLCDLNDLIVTLEVCNTGNNELSFTTPITFYTDDPTANSATALDTEELGVTIPADSCATVEYTIPAQYDEPVFIVVNDDNTTNTPFDLANDFPNTNIGECDYNNNITSFTEMPEPFELDLGGTITICDNSAIELNATTHFVSYEWQDGTTDSTFTAYDGGMYWVEVVDSCGGIQTDTVELIVDPNTVNMVMPEQAVVCPTQDTSFTVVGDFDTYLWLPDDFLDCDTCQTVNVIDPDTETQYIVTASNSMTGCYSVDTVILSIAGPITTFDGVEVCPGEAVMIHGNMVTDPMTYTENFTSVDGCDSISSVTLVNFEPLTLSFQTVPTCPEGALGSASVFVANGVATSYEWSIPGAGDVPTVNNLEAGTYTVTVTDGNNCENVASVTIDVDDTIILTTDFIPPSCPGDADGELEVTNPMVQWQYSLDGVTFQNNPIFMDLPAGNYDIFIQDGDCLFQGAGVVNDPPAIVVDITSDPDSIPYPDSAQLTVNVSPPGNYIFDWTPSENLSCENCPNPMVSSISENTYSVTVTNENGCTAEGQITPPVNSDCDFTRLEIPNAFTPDGDDVNDTFSPVRKNGGALEQISDFRIYNRWGNLVYESAEGEPWDGTDGGQAAPMDVYVYYLLLECITGEQEPRSGEVTLIR
ncbi:MAG: FG-GAP-like repeat-containing protein [Bacteroidota bacterium]